MALTAAQNALVDRVEYHADQVTADAQTVGLNRDAAYQQLEETALAVLQQLPRSLLMPLVEQTSPNVYNSSALPITAVYPPLDWLRHIRVQLEEWQRPLYQLSDPRSNHWRLQYNTYTQGDPRHPAGISTPLNVDSQRVLTAGGSYTDELIACAPQDSGPTVTDFAYIPETAPENFPNELVDLLIWKATARVLEAQKEQAAVDAEERAMSLMSDLKVGYAPPGSYRT